MNFQISPPTELILDGKVIDIHNDANFSEITFNAKNRSIIIIFKRGNQDLYFTFNKVSKILIKGEIESDIISGENETVNFMTFFGPVDDPTETSWPVEIETPIGFKMELMGGLFISLIFGEVHATIR